METMKLPLYFLIIAGGTALFITAMWLLARAGEDLGEPTARRVGWGLRILFGLMLIPGAIRDHEWWLLILVAVVLAVSVVMQLRAPKRAS